MLDQTPRDASVILAQLRLSPEDSRAMAADLWSLDALALRYRALAETLDCLIPDVRSYIEQLRTPP